MELSLQSRWVGSGLVWFGLGLRLDTYFLFHDDDAGGEGYG